MTEVGDILTAIQVSLATLNGKVDTLGGSLNGKVDTLDSRMGAESRQSAQMLELVRTTLSNQAADIGTLSAIVRENEVKANDAASNVRVDLEKQNADLRRDMTRAIDRLAESVNDLKQWRARVVGVAVGAASLASVATAIVMKAVGA